MRSLFLFLATLCATWPAYAKDYLPPDPEFDEILSRDLSALTVTSVAQRAQRLSDTPAAVYVITQEQLRRTGTYNIPDALRLAPGLQVARAGADRWAVSARGFNNTLSNKLLVLIDGRPVYTPVFSGVYWGDQSTSIHDIERIEVIRGPGASIYGANAVNGVISIITKSAENTQGNFLSATTTSKGNGLYEARHGGRIAPREYYRVYGQYVDGANWFKGRSGFRMDGSNLEGSSYTLQGDAYGGQQDAKTRTPLFVSPFTGTVRSEDDSYGGNVLGRWKQRFSVDSEISLQAYVDHYARLESSFEQRISTADIQLQHSMKLNARNHFIWGMGGRVYYQDLAGTVSASTEERFDTHELVNAFVQNEYALVPDTLSLTLGSKFEHNDFTGFEIQPTARLAWYPAENQTVWAAVSRAVRTPSIVEDNISLLAQVTDGPLTEYRIAGNPDQQSEELVAYELGYRIQPTSDLSFDAAFFLNDYDKLTTIGMPGAPYIGANGNMIVEYPVNNRGYGQVYGAEFAASWNVSDDWRLSGSYTYLKMDLDVSPGTATSLEGRERLAPRHAFTVQSFYNLRENVHWDNMLYYVDELSAPVDGYLRYDMRLAWLVKPGLETSLIGRNLIDPHMEFPSAHPTNIGRSLVGQVLWKF